MKKKSHVAPDSPKKATFCDTFTDGFGHVHHHVIPDCVKSSDQIVYAPVQVQQKSIEQPAVQKPNYHYSNGIGSTINAGSTQQALMDTRGSNFFKDKAQRSSVNIC
jgi:hypothetical protein